MSAMTEMLDQIAETIRESGCLNDPDALWTGRTAVRIALDDETEDGEEYLYFEFSDKLDDGTPDFVWIPEDCLAKAPMLTANDMASYFNH